MNAIFAILRVLAAAVLAVLVERLIEFVLKKFPIEVNPSNPQKAIIFVASQKLQDN